MGETSTAQTPAALPTGWIFSAVLLVCLSIMPLLVPRLELKTQASEPQPVTSLRAAPVARVLVIVIDALGANRVQNKADMPLLHQRDLSEASGVSMAAMPTVTVAGVRSLFSGYRREYRPGTNPESDRDPEKDSVFARAGAAGLRSFVVGPMVYQTLFPDQAGRMFLQAGHDLPPNSDPGGLRQAKLVMQGRYGKWDLLVVHLFDLDSMGHAHLIDRALVREKLRWLDRAVETLAAAAGKDACVIVTGDHGQIASGTHGGNEPIERRTPFVMWGRRVQKGSLGSFPQTDVAPTIAALLGLPPPARSTGRPLLDALVLPPTARVGILMDWAEQQKQQWLAAKSDWPWLRHDPSSDLDLAHRLWSHGNYVRAGEMAERAIAEMREALSEFSPRRWFGTLVLMACLLTLAAFCGALCRGPGAALVPAAVWTGAGCVLALALPLAHPGFWPVASWLGFFGAAVLLALSAYSFKGAAGGDGRERSLAVAGLAAICIPAFVDINLWAWLVVLAACVWRWRAAQPQDRLHLGLCFLALSVCALLSLWLECSETSVARLLLPHFAGLRRWAPHRLSEAAALAGVAACYYFDLSGLPLRRRLTTYAFVFAPMAVSIVNPPLDISSLAWNYAACWISLGASALFRLPEGRRLQWLSLILLVLGRSFTDSTEFCFLALATYVGWVFARTHVRGRPILEGLALLGLLLWAYTMPPARMDFSALSLGAAAQRMGSGWHPAALALLVGAQHLIIFSVPVLPWLARLEFASAASTIPFLGAASAASLAFLWLEYYVLGTSSGHLSLDHRFESSAWLALFAWGILLVWSLARHGRRIVRRLSLAVAPKDAR